jgi:hypothetical protein
MAQETTEPERWSVDAGPADVATLDIPPSLQRDRRFHISCRFVVALRQPDDSAWHSLKVYVDGALEWSRRIATSNPGSSDSLDVSFRRDVPSGQPLRVVATTDVHRVQRVALDIEADEEL